MPAGDDHLASRGQGGQGGQRRSGVVVQDNRRFGPGQLLEQALDGMVPPPVLSGNQVEFDACIVAGRRGHRRHGAFGQDRPAQPRVQDDAGRIDHRAERPLVGFKHSPGDPIGQLGDARQGVLGGGSLKLQADFIEDRADRVDHRVVADPVHEALEDGILQQFVH